MKKTFIITGLHPITTNQTHRTIIRGRRPAVIKSEKYQQFESIFHSKMRLHKTELNSLNKNFDDKKHSLEITYKFYCPILTKKGFLMKRSKDLDNMIKPTQDCLFKHFLFDDSLATKINSEKIHSETPRIEIEVKILTFYNN